MKRATFKVLFYIKRTKKMKDGTNPIYARVTVNGERAEFALQKSITDNQWNKDKGCVRGTTNEAKKINKSLDLVRNKLYGSKLEFQEKGVDVTAAALRNSYLGIEENPRTILGVFREHNERCKSLINIDFAQGTYQRYETCYKHIQQFILKSYNKEDLMLTDITQQFIKDFEFYLKTQRKCCHNTATKYLKNFKKIIRIAIANSWMKKDPFSSIKFHLDEVDIDYLTENELNSLIGKQFRIERLQQVKDVYLFCCFTGLAFIDVKKLNQNHIIEKNGRLWIKKRRQKTKNWCDIPLLDPAIQLIRKYENNLACRNSDVLFPVLTNQKMNAYLKEIADICGIDKNLSTHTARHTFATTVTLANQISIEVVSKMLGHSSINMTKKYARVVDDLIHRDMKKIYGKFQEVTVC